MKKHPITQSPTCHDAVRVRRRKEDHGSHVEGLLGISQRGAFNHGSLRSSRWAESPIAQSMGLQPYECSWRPFRPRPISLSRHRRKRLCSVLPGFQPGWLTIGAKRKYPLAEQSSSFLQIKRMIPRPRHTQDAISSFEICHSDFLGSLGPWVFRRFQSSSLTYR